MKKLSYLTGGFGGIFNYEIKRAIVTVGNHSNNNAEAINKLIDEITKLKKQNQDLHNKLVNFTNK